jgi:hypothetical protein
MTAPTWNRIHEAISERLAIDRAEVEGLTKEGDLLAVMAAVTTLHENLRTLSELAKEGNKEREAIKSEVIPRTFEAMPRVRPPLTVAGYRVSLTTRVTASIIDKAAGHEWLRTSGYGAMIVPTVNASALAGLAKLRIMEENRDMPEELFRVQVGRTATFSKVRDEEPAGTGKIDSSLKFLKEGE